MKRRRQTKNPLQRSSEIIPLARERHLFPLGLAKLVPVHGKWKQVRCTANWPELSALKGHTSCEQEYMGTKCPLGSGIFSSLHPSLL